MISGWRRERRLGPPPRLERLDIYCKPPLFAFLATTALVPFVLWVKFGWPPALEPRQIVFVWCAMFGMMMVPASESTWRNGLWREMAGLIIVTAAIIAIVWLFALPVGTAIGLVPPLVYPVTP